MQESSAPSTFPPLIWYCNDIYLVKLVIFIIVGHSELIFRQPFHAERYGLHKAAFRIGPDFPFPVPGLLIDIRAAYMVVLDDDGVCPLGRDKNLPACHKQSVTAAPKRAGHQEEAPPIRLCI